METDSQTTPEPIESATPAAEPAAQDTESQEWDSATKEIFPGLKIAKKEPNEDESAKSTEDGKKEEKIEPDPAKKEPDAKRGDGDEASGEGEENPDEDEAPDNSVRDARVAAREAAREVEEVASDVRQKMFPDTPTELKDAEGDPIKSVEDVMKLRNPSTGDAFTESEAATWLLSAQQQFKEHLASIDKQVNQIAEVNVDLKDQADLLMADYGELLKAMPELQDELWAAFKDTLVTDEKTGLITKAPVSMVKFYRAALAPYGALARKMEADEQASAAKEAADQAAAAQAAETARKQTRADRSDIFGRGKTDNMDSEEKDWADAATAVFGPRK